MNEPTKAKCSFCDRDATFGPYEGAHSCESCARRVADLAAFVQERALGSIWASIGPGAEQALAPSVKAEDIDAERGAADASNPVWFEAPTIASRPPPAR